MRIHLATDSGLMTFAPEENLNAWEMKLSNRSTQCVAVDPLRPELVYCGTLGDGAWRSVDAGRSWRPAGPGITHSKVYSIAVSGNERVGERGVVYAGTEPSMIFRSENGGESWQKCSGLAELPSAIEWRFPPRPDTHHVRWIHPDPHVAGRLYAAIEAGALIRSDDGGRQWQDRVETGPIDTHQLATPRQTPGRLYSAAGDGFFESRDGGATWEQREEGLSHTYLWSIAADSGDADTIVVSAAESPRASHHKPDAESFLYRRTKGSAWQRIRTGLPDAVGRRNAVLAAHPGEQGVFVAVWERDLFRSTDSGASWELVNLSWPHDLAVNEPRALTVCAN